MDGIREQLVARPRTSEDNVKKIIILAAAILLAVLALAGIYIASKGMLLPIGFLAAGLIIWGGWWLTEQFNVEYEYTVIGQEMRVDKILNKRSRKLLCEVQLKKADAFYSSEKHLNGASEISACGDGDRYSIEFSDQKYGKTVLIFTPDERTLEAIKPYLPRAI